MNRESQYSPAAASSSSRARPPSRPGPCSARADASETNDGGIPLRPLGRTGENVTMIALGGHHSTSHQQEKESIRLIQRAVDEGISFMDNCWDYHDGVAEERMGKALAEGGRRDKVFLMTKVCGRTAKEAQSNLEDSLRRLKTDHIDLWQFHEIVYDNDPDWIFADGRRHPHRPEGPQGRQGPLPRLHRPQGPVDPPQDAQQALRLGDACRCR